MKKNNLGLRVRSIAFVAVAYCICRFSFELNGQTAQNDLSVTPLSTNLSAKVAADYEKYQKGQIDKGQMMESVWDANNQTRQDIYGKVIDQYGKPVVGAEVKGIAERIESFNERFTTYKTQTDAEGLFQFTDLRGYRLDAEVTKAGYEIIYQGGRVKPPGPSAPTNRVIFNMWKLRGPEPMIHDKLHSYIPCDGTVTHFDLLTGKEDPDGALCVSLTRNPVNIERRKPFDWTLTLQITNGGLQTITNIYPYEAPADGYQPSLTFHYDPGSTNWTSQIQPKLYFKGENDRIFGRMTLRVMADFQPPPTLFDAEIYANPNSSRNLEFDSSKQLPSRK